MIEIDIYINQIKKLLPILVCKAGRVWKYIEAPLKAWESWGRVTCDSCSSHKEPPQSGEWKDSIFLFYSYMFRWWNYAISVGKGS